MSSPKELSAYFTISKLLAKKLTMQTDETLNQIARDILDEMLLKAKLEVLIDLIKELRNVGSLSQERFLEVGHQIYLAQEACTEDSLAMMLAEQNVVNDVCWGYGIGLSPLEKVDGMLGQIRQFSEVESDRIYDKVLTSRIGWSTKDRMRA